MGLTRSASTATLALAFSLPLFRSGSLVASARADESPAQTAEKAEGSGISPEALAVLADAQRALVAARELAAKLDEPAALARLLSAERSLRDILQVPGVHAWLAEVWLQMALVAAQRGELALADSLFAQALTLDPTRSVGAAEAAPPVIARSQAVARTRDAAQPSRFRIEPSPNQATFSIDGRMRGSGATEVELTPGLHLLLLEAPGYRAQGTLVDALPGMRRPFVLALTPNPQEQERLAASAELPSPNPPSVHIRRSDSPLEAEIPDKQRWWKRWPVWASAASAAVLGGVVIGLATRNERTEQRRTLSVDPGAPEP